MNWFTTSIRRAMLLVALGATGGGAYTWWRNRQPGTQPIDPPEWPPLSDSTTTAESTNDVSMLVNALVDTPDARSGISDGTWASPNPDGSCPDGFTIKANDNSGIYHVPTGRFYARTKAERCYATAEAAEADGYRAAKS